MLDMDETLLHSSVEKLPDHEIIISQIDDFGRPLTIYAKLRPFVSVFIEFMSEYYDLAIFTAAQKEYADALIDKFDIHKLIKTRFYRENCTIFKKCLVKDLSRLKRNLKDIILVDVAIDLKLGHFNVHETSASKWISY